MKWPFRFSGKTPESEPRPSSEIRLSVQQWGAFFEAEGFDGPDWLQTPLAFAGSAEKVLLLAQLEEEGIALKQDQGLLLPWRSYYAIAASEAYQDSLALLGLPEIASLRPVLSSRGSLSDPDFAIILSGWLDAQGIPAAKNYKRVGAVLETGESRSLLTEAAYKTLEAVSSFHTRAPESRHAEAHKLAWSQIRRLATDARADLSDFLKKTMILTPDKLDLELRKVSFGDSSTLEVIPGFAGAPEAWLSRFDRSGQVQSHYEIPDGEGLTHIILTPEVQTVLKEIKRMPGRRVAGARAEAFVRNPIALLGTEAATVIVAEQFEAARDQAGIGFSRFTAQVLRDEQETPYAVSLLVEESIHGEIRSETLLFEGIETLEKFITKLQTKIDQGAQCCVWEGYELEILGDTPEQLALLKTALAEIRQSKTIRVSELFDLSQYSDRILGFGQEKPYFSPYITKKNEDDTWFPENVVFGMGYTPVGSDEPIVIAFTDETLEQFQNDLTQAKLAGHASFAFPGAPKPLLISEAEDMNAIFQAARHDLASGHFEPQKPEKAKAPKKQQGLVIKPNLEQVDYEESRGPLKPPQDAVARLPVSLRSGISLKEHQKAGLLWLQHLWSKSPAECRGALLADDMGLGKTLQLLSFMASCLEAEPEIDPFLVVAPVSLLENWKEEIEKFFEPQAFSVLLLYGKSLAEKRLPPAEIGSELADAGIGKLLRPDWLGKAKVVLTTYETLRDLEFSLARQRWSAVICDEAQKIKNPNAMVTRAAKKQNARFKIACTGTPVENTLTDLWCLFDFIQPGLLQSLNAFGSRYRKPIEAETNEEKARLAELRQLIQPQTMRRTKAEVATDLPRKIEVKNCQQLVISSQQRALYAHAVGQFRKRSKDHSQNKGLQSPLGLLQYLRRVCTDPISAGASGSNQVTVPELEKHSPKMAWLLKELEAIKAKDEKVIVFCEFRDLQRTLQKCIAERFLFLPDVINGDSPVAADSPVSRQGRIRAFQQKSGFDVIILSPLAVGFGVNIQAANHVIHFTRTWNPAKEDQATDRAYRIGQTRDVYVYYLVVVADDFTTFDAKLHRLLEQKRELSNDMLNGTGEVSTTDFQDLESIDGESIYKEQVLSD